MSVAIHRDRDWSIYGLFEDRSAHLGRAQEHRRMLAAESSQNLRI